MDTIAKGRAAEAAVVAALMDAGLTVLVPFAGAAPYDLAVEVWSGEVVKVQVKTGRVRGDAVIFNSCGTDHGRGPRQYHGLADLFAVHVRALGQIYILDVTGAPTSKTSLRLRPARNNQRARIQFADDFTLERWLASLPSGA